MYCGIVLAAIVLISGFATFMQNYRSESIMESFKNFIPQVCKVLRNGKWGNILASKVFFKPKFVI